MGLPLAEAAEAKGGGPSGANPDVSLLYDINGLAKDAPGWFDHAMGFMGEYGIVPAMAVLMACAWWSVRRGRDTAPGMAALLWAPVAAGLALLVNIPIRDFVRRPRPALEHPGLDILVKGKTDFSFVSDHATLTMALGVGLFIAHRRYGLIGIGLAFVEAFCRVFMGVHYPTDVVGGLALGTAVVLLPAPVAMMLLTPLVRWVGTTRAAALVRSRRMPAPRAVPEPDGAVDEGARSRHRDNGLAA
ncbi:phosphatase PAP2 family protein [Streptomyces orinoci]|uniref:Phosphatase PAP2 family protein n=1 Tax=Streptomyces orinoci TaxID=67339 RepID=A0ABV3JV44_STRON|nr:phosphatase PAP2 family protein [Streptomyces orinoci]